MDHVIAALQGASYRCANEDELQRAVAGVLDASGIAYEREVRLSPQDRVDFLIDGAIALELKVRTSSKNLLSQILRYAKHDRVTAVLVAGTTHHVLLLPETANGKPVRAVHLRGW